MRRRTVSFHQVLLPFVITVGCGIIVLLVWSIVDPLRWAPDDNDDGVGEIVTYGNCESESHGILSFLFPLIALFVIVMAMAVSIVWKMRDVQKEFSDAKGIFIGIILHLCIWTVVSPLFILADDVSKDLAFMLTVATVVAFANVFIGTIVMPKMMGHLCGGSGSVPSLQFDHGGGRSGAFGQGSIRITGLNRSSDSMPIVARSNSVELYSINGAFHDSQARISLLESEVRSLKAALDDARRNDSGVMIDPRDDGDINDITGSKRSSNTNDHDVESK